jgi:hypothetical protein
VEPRGAGASALRSALSPASRAVALLEVPDRLRKLGQRLWWRHLGRRWRRLLLGLICHLVERLALRPRRILRPPRPEPLELIRAWPSSWSRRPYCPRVGRGTCLGEPSRPNARVRVRSRKVASTNRLAAQATSRPGPWIRGEGTCSRRCGRGPTADVAPDEPRLLADADFRRGETHQDELSRRSRGRNRPLSAVRRRYLAAPDTDPSTGPRRAPLIRRCRGRTSDRRLWLQSFDAAVPSG